ncbi:hypothetical protein [Mycobacterium vicinigordonae]|uniref:Uncharacterized protein n=1 Tax=Mycobacterium vicinigordonae TaxID=1719132 RepID=A0A7D6E8Y0_9MYCO|nr:hypothetical protein [Mycobacterium vicinigordonae]QLL09283.1 hypothetical protein H0P51_10585 [Mycobacterium vicinigordonae]
MAGAGSGNVGFGNTGVLVSGFFNVGAIRVARLHPTVHLDGATLRR